MFLGLLVVDLRCHKQTGDAGYFLWRKLGMEGSRDKGFLYRGGKQRQWHTDTVSAQLHTKDKKANVVSTVVAEWSQQ